MKLPRFVIKFIGDSFLHNHFPFYIYKPSLHKVKGSEVRKVLNEVREGDILFRRFDGYISSIFIPGFWTHVGLYLGNNRIAHAIGEGVVEEDILDFCRTDHLALVRPSVDIDQTIKAKKLAIANINNHTQYDYEFKSGNNKVYCTEFVNNCYSGLYDSCFVEQYGNRVLIPDNMYYNRKVAPYVSFHR